MDRFISQLGELLGVTPVTAALLIGGLIGFALATLLVRFRSTGAVVHGPLAPGLSSANRTPVQFTSSDYSSVVVGESEQGTTLDPQVSAQVLELISKGKKIEAIKTVREHTGFGLTEAKAIIDGLERVQGLLPRGR